MASRKEVQRELEKYLSRHPDAALGAEGYDFNIKIYRIDIPDLVHDAMTPEEVDVFVQNEMGARVHAFIEVLLEEFPWVSDVVQSGRMGGWLVVNTEEPVLDEQGGIPDLKEARKRLDDLDEIKRRIKEAQRLLIEQLESPPFWRMMLTKPRSVRKHWDPRRKV